MEGGLFFGISPVTYWINSSCQGAEQALPKSLMVLARQPCTERVSLRKQKPVSAMQRWGNTSEMWCVLLVTCVQEGLSLGRQEYWGLLGNGELASGEARGVWPGKVGGWQGITAVYNSFRLLVILGEKKAVFPGGQTLHKSPTQSDTCNAWILSDIEVLGVENMFICWRKGWCFVLACSFMYLNQGCTRSFPVLHSRVPLGSLSLGLNLQKLFPLLCYLFLGQDKYKMPLHQEVKSLS